MKITSASVRFALKNTVYRATDKKCGKADYYDQLVVESLDSVT